MAFEYSLSGKRLELLKQIAPGVTRAAVLRDPTQGSGNSEFAAVQTVAPSLRVEVNPVNLRDPDEFEHAVAAFARAPDGGLIVTAGPAARRHRDLIVALAARHKLPAVYNESSFAAVGGLISYGPISPTSTAARPATSTASSRARSQPICRCRRRQDTRRC
jgi:putative ABC transport system substrate-binding protein